MIRDKTVSISARKDSASRSIDGVLRLPSRYAMFREWQPSFVYHSDLGIPMKDLRKITKWLKEYGSNMIDASELSGKLQELGAGNRKSGQPSSMSER
ncbi:hypothetical protein [Paenibacillus paeoniae]|uniref:Uncharacterized protein n=1 Tax=Paenibacillus paeoniae TaxID=2292705 RepID=A0A371PMS2_9BACL|nr:hypothetical protein [Paenibacillus paeoniae]REK77502.1 hypothetical protein DX130_11045 [Paenibacillus paeoniae]